MIANPSFEVIKGMRHQSEIVFLDFHQIPKDLPKYKNIHLFFEDAIAQGTDPKLPENRQIFNDTFLHTAHKTVLIGRYQENRIEMLRGSRIALEGRTIHLGIDLFTKDTAPVYAPYQARVVVADRENSSHSYGNYCILEHSLGEAHFFTFYGHLSSLLPKVGLELKAGQQFASLGDYKNDENGGWSRHVHIQLLTSLPKKGAPPIGYSTVKDLPKNSLLFPDPNTVLQIPLLA